MTAATATNTTATASDLAILHQLNHDYIRSVDQSDVHWFDDNLAEDFLNSNTDCTLVDRAGFLKQIAKKSPVTSIAACDVRIVLRDNFAFIHAGTTYTKPDGQAGTGRYTDVWRKLDGRWRCVSAHVTRG
jgi:ketosteroid isomerase-like protein